MLVQGVSLLLRQGAEAWYAVKNTAQGLLAQPTALHSCWDTASPQSHLSTPYCCSLQNGAVNPQEQRILLEAFESSFP